MSKERAKEQKTERRAQALRLNLARRKAQQRARTQAGPEKTGKRGD